MFCNQGFKYDLSFKAGSGDLSKRIHDVHRKIKHLLTDHSITCVINRTDKKKQKNMQHMQQYKGNPDGTSSARENLE